MKERGNVEFDEVQGESETARGRDIQCRSQEGYVAVVPREGSIEALVWDGLGVRCLFDGQRLTLHNVTSRQLVVPENLHFLLVMFHVNFSH